MSLPALLSLALLAPPSQAPELAMLVTRPWSGTTELQLAGREVARFSHIENAAVRGAMVEGTGRYVAVADTSPRRDLSYAASLFVLTADLPARRLCDELVHASRPLVGPDARVYVVRGVAGPASPGPRLRTDFLRIDEVDLETGAVHTLHAHTGQFLHLAGWHDDAVIAYRIDPDGAADLVAIDTAPPHAVHPLADIPPFARDFTVDGDQLVFLNRDEDDPHTWHIEQLDLATTATRTLTRDVSMRAQPFAAAGTLYAATRGAALDDLATPCATDPTPGCTDAVRIATPRWLAGLHVRPGALPRPFLLDTTTGRATLVPAPDAWIDLLGFPGGAP